MSNKPRKKKKYSATASHARVSKVAVRHIGVMFVTDGQPCYAVDTKTKAILKHVPNSLYESIVSVPYKWKTYACVLGRDGSGNNYMKTQVIQAEQPYHQAVLIDTFNDAHKKLLKEFNPYHLMCAAWFASPLGEEVDDDFLYEIFDKRGAWVNFEPGWEIKQKQETETC